jgi:hypothetical protein
MLETYIGIKPNQHIEDYLDYYCNLSIPPEYALLIKGSWGSGKSHIIKNVIKRFEDKRDPVKFLYISLYGISAIEDIEIKFFQILNPILSSKGSIFAGKIAKGLLKGVLRLDFDGDGKSDGSVSIGAPDIDLAKYLVDTSNCVLIFDDLERCSLPIKEILGYINYYVEKDGYKAILVGDEEKISSSSGDDCDSYNLIKEKLIGKTLEVEPEISPVFDRFTSDLIENSNTKKEIIKRKPQMLEVFHRAGYKNLRSLRKCILDLSRIWSGFDSCVVEKDQLLDQFVTLFSVFSFEIYSGSIKPSDIPKLISITRLSQRAFSSDKDAKPDEFEMLSNKYDINFSESLFGEAQWVDIFDRGIFDFKNINILLKKSVYFQEENTPEWMRLWNYFDLEDDEFEKYYKDFKTKFDSFEYLDIGVIKHLLGILIKLKEEDVLSGFEDNSIVSIFESYLDRLFLTPDFSLDDDVIERTYGYSNYAGYQYLNSEHQDFEEVSNYLIEKINVYFKAKLVSSSSEILECIKNNIESLPQILNFTMKGKGKYESKPVLNLIDVESFFDVFMSIPNKSKIKISKCFCYRYESEYKMNRLKDEYSWLTLLLSKIKDKEGDMSASITKTCLKNFISQTEGILKNWNM